MIKKLLIVASVALTVTASAQTGRIVTNTQIFEANSEISKSITYKAAIVGCDTISTAQNASLALNTAGSDTTTPGCSPKAGFVFGSNCYQDKEKANYFPIATYSSVAQATVTGVIVTFFKNLTRGTGGAPTTTVGMTLYNGSLAGGPTTVLSQTMATMTQILAAQANPSITAFNYLFSLPAGGVVAPTTGGFFASIVVPTVSASGDTAVVFNSPASTIDYGYEKWSNDSWHSISSAWGASLKANLSFYPIVCGNLVVTGISKNLGLSKDVKIMPNPSTGLVNLTVTLPNTQDLNITVTNALGQVIVNNNYNSVLVDVISLDLTNQNNGVYFVTVSNGKDKMVQRLILNK